jgi:hypothetical protein
MTKDYIQKLISRAEKLQVMIGSPSQHLDQQMYLMNILQEANGLIGYILALKEAKLED